MNETANKNELQIELLTQLLIDSKITWYPRNLAKCLVSKGVTVNCSGCDNFLGGGDFGLCCKVRYELCYTDTPACEQYKQEEATEDVE